MLSAKEVGRRVIELYWPQTIPYAATAVDVQPRVLSQAPQNDCSDLRVRKRQAPLGHLGTPVPNLSVINTQTGEQPATIQNPRN